jgi:ABC-type nitrate/sulfonate/bicarbonate transport system ATPase subunit
VAAAGGATKGAGEMAVKPAPERGQSEPLGPIERVAHGEPPYQIADSAFDGATRPVVEVRGVGKDFRDAAGGVVRALEDVSLAVGAGEFVALVGPSGSGKSTLLAIVAGLDEPTTGEVALRGDAGARRLGRVGYMPQRDLLLPWRTALGNAITGLEVRGVPAGVARAQARALFADFGLAGFEDAYPHTLSGGMRQRVAFARTVLAGGDPLLLDEPFGALDALTRAALQRWLAEIWGGLARTCLLVTHDVDEALLLADRICVFTARPGHVRLERAVPLERPRRPGMLARPEAARLKAELLEALVGEPENGLSGAEADGRAQDGATTNGAAGREA